MKDKDRYQQLAGIIKEEENEDDNFTTYEFDSDFKPKEENTELYKELEDKKIGK